MARPIGLPRLPLLVCVVACLLSSVTYGQYPGCPPQYMNSQQPWIQQCPPQQMPYYPYQQAQPGQNPNSTPQSNSNQSNQTQQPVQNPQQDPGLQPVPSPSPFADVQNAPNLAQFQQGTSTTGGQNAFGAPNMIGDSLGTFGTAAFAAMDNLTSETIFGEFDIPLTGRIPKIAENNSPMPRDRVYFAYNHFHGAYGYDSLSEAPNPAFDPLDPLSSPTLTSTHNLISNVNRFTLGLEKTFFSDDISLELRLPLMTQSKFSTDRILTPGSNSFESGSDDPTGDLAINYKQILYTAYGRDTSFLFSWGMGLTLPTGEGNTTRIFDTYLHIEDSAIHFNPFLALLYTKQNFFMQAFFQFDFTNDEIHVREGTSGQVAEYMAPHRSHIDVGLGYWIFQDRTRAFLQGVAPMLEFHYTGQINETEAVSIPLTGTNSIGQIDLNTPESARDVYNLTTGLNFQLTSWANCRVAGVVPFTTNPNREFDSEIVFQLDLTR